MKEENKTLIEQYVNNICSCIKWKAVHKQITLEIEDHIYTMIEEYQDRGMEENHAVQKAIEQMGMADMVGKQLNKIHKPAPDWGLLLLVSLFSSIGLLAIYFLQQYGANSGSYQYLSIEKSIVFIILGIATGTILYFIDYRKIQPYSRYIYGLTLIMLLFVLNMGETVNGRPYLRIFDTSINFIAMSPYLLIISLGGMFAHWEWQQPKNVFLGIGLIMIPILLISMGPSMVAASLFLVAALVMMYFSGAKLSHVLGVPIALFGILVFMIGGQGRRLTRLLTFLNPYRDPNGVGYMTIQSSKAISSAGFFGRGFGVENILLPELHTDLIFTYLVYTFGWIAGCVMVISVITFIIKLLKMSNLIQDVYGKLLIIGFAVIISLQYIWNILMTLGFAPMVGVGMPFVSYGGLTMIVYFAVIGLISSVYKRRSMRVM